MDQSVVPPDPGAEPATPFPPSAIPASEHIAFSNNRSEFRRLVMRGALLELITVGFYRFWLATDIRRHLWRNTSAGGDALEYTGNGKELLIGALFALAIFAPIYILYFIIGLEAERMKAFASVPLGLFFYLFTQFAIYRARRYRLTRTIWRGVRFWMTGSGWSYAWRSFLWAMLAGITIGFALPWREAALERFKMHHSFYGDLPGHFDGTGWEYFKRGWWLWLLTLLILVGPFFAAPFVEVQVRGSRNMAAFSIFLWVGTVLIALPFIYGAFKAITWRWWASGIRFGEVRFESDLKRSGLFGLYWKVIGWSLLFLLGIGVWAGSVFGVASQIYGAVGTAQQQAMIITQHPLVLVIFGLGYVLFALAAGVIMRIYLIHDIWGRIAASTTVYNIASAENVAARGAAVSALGEGLADSLDVFGF
jgi:uncharacterized membrane protein YjgN (DUF898 family)